MLSNTGLVFVVIYILFNLKKNKMKKVVLLMLLGGVLVNAQAQKLKSSDVPSSITQSFHKAYPSVKDVDWGKEGDKYEAEFDNNKTDMSVTYDNKGNLLETEMEISVQVLPQSIKDYVMKNYPSEKIKEAAKMTDPQGVVTYEAEVKKMDLIFDEDGNFKNTKKDSD